MPLVEAPGPGLLTVSEPVPWFCKSAALRATVNVVEFTNVVGFAAPFHITAEFASNPVPVTVTVAGAPGGTYRGVTALIAGAGLFTVNVVIPDVPPPGAGFCTLIWAIELPAKSAAGSVAFSCVAPTKVVARAVPFHAAAELEIKPVPLMVTIVSAVPAVSDDGDNAVTVGTGFEAGAGLDVDPPPPHAIMMHMQHRIAPNNTHVGRSMASSQVK